MDKFIIRRPKVSSELDEMQITTTANNDVLTIPIQTMEDGVLGSARITPDKQHISVIDVISSITKLKQSSKYWNDLKKKIPDLKSSTSFYKFSTGGKGQRNTPIISFDNLVLLLAAMSHNYQRAFRFMHCVQELLRKYISADITLADDILQRNNNRKDIQWLANRTKSKLTVLQLNESIKNHNGHGKIYPIVSNLNNVAITGQTAKQLQLSRGINNNQTRDGLTDSELIRLSFLQDIEYQKFNVDNVNGNQEIANSVKLVVDNYKAFQSKLF